MNKPTLQSTQNEATAWAQRQAIKEAADPALKALMDALREAQDRFFAAQC